MTAGSMGRRWLKLCCCGCCLLLGAAETIEGPSRSSRHWAEISEASQADNPGNELSRSYDADVSGNGYGLQRSLMRRVSTSPGGSMQRASLIEQSRSVFDASFGKVSQREMLRSGVAKRDITVWCGHHSATVCSACPQGKGGTWCNGECEWRDDACTFREDLVWCGGHGAANCSACYELSTATEAEGAQWCNGECVWHGERCLHPRELLLPAENDFLPDYKMRTAGTATAAEDEVREQGETVQNDMPPIETVFYGTGAVPLGTPVHLQPSMNFWDYGACNFDKAQGTEMGPQPVADCMRICLDSKLCIAAAVGGANGGNLFSGTSSSASFECVLYAGNGVNFTVRPGLDRCYRKAKPGEILAMRQTTPIPDIIPADDAGAPDLVAAAASAGIPAGASLLADAAVRKVHKKERTLAGSVGQVGSHGEAFAAKLPAEEGVASLSQVSEEVFEVDVQPSFSALPTLAPILYWLPKRRNFTNLTLANRKRLQTDLTKADNATIQAGVRAVKKHRDSEAQQNGADDKLEVDSVSIEGGPGQIPITKFTVGAPLLSLALCWAAICGRSCCGLEDGEYGEESRAVPKRLLVAGTGRSDGAYEVVKGRRPGGHALWKHMIGDFWIYSGQDGRWLIGEIAEAEKKFKAKTGKVASEHQHAGTMPHDIEEGTWQRFEDGTFVTDKNIVFQKMPA
eukprot:TRINITY_DN24960_c0_g2_i1.p1 TRINITY_DN24960_c0_g2~~TRINITY_DN24960_c0_g2_i1.p1  ORF type:complete len:684 (+),score=115.02 TRINITY_DN24960_c0_g2_i1:88-2139(+)